ncbi:MAG: hypothetical protein V3S25_00640 [Nitrospirales bacterium]
MEAPNDVRHFVHKRIVGAIVGGITGGGPIGAIGGFLRPTGRSGGQPTAPTSGRQVDFVEFHPRSGKQHTHFVGEQPCKPPRRLDVDGQCRFPGSPADISVGGGMAGNAVMGRFGAALSPMTDSRITRECLPGMVLGKDNLCYNKRDIRNSERKWPKGRRPLGTPGEMAALAKAASFGRRMETTVKRMQKIGVLKKPSRGRSRRPHTPKMLTPGIVQIQQE